MCSQEVKSACARMWRGVRGQCEEAQEEREGVQGECKGVQGSVQGSAREHARE
jgi:hypothetical protein